MHEQVIAVSGRPRGASKSGLASVASLAAGQRQRQYLRKSEFESAAVHHKLQAQVRLAFRTARRSMRFMRFIGSNYSDGDTRGHRSDSMSDRYCVEETHVRRVREVDELRTYYVRGV